jgi:hypothetical protein
VRAARGPERVAARARRAHRACAPRVADNQIGNTGAKELAAALKVNATLTTLGLGGACSGAPPHPRCTAAHAHACRGGVRLAAPSALPHALAAPTARAHRVPQIIRSA